MKINTLGWMVGLCASVALMAVSSAEIAVPSPALKIGDPVPAIDAMAWIKGEPVKKLQPGRVYVVEFWATWCGPCNRMMPHLSELQAKYAGQLTIVGVNARESESGGAELGAVTEFVKKRGAKMAYTVAMDDPVKKTVFNAWMGAGGSYGIPTAFIVGRDGKLAWMGYPSDPHEYSFDAALADALAGKSDLARARALQAQVNLATAKRLAEKRSKQTATTPAAR